MASRRDVPVTTQEVTGIDSRRKAPLPAKSNGAYTAQQATLWPFS